MLTHQPFETRGPRPRLAAIVSTDWPALLCAMSLPVVWLLSAQLPFVSRDAGIGAFEALVGALCGSLAALAFLAWRIARIHRLFARGRPVRGRIGCLDMAKDRARLELVYESHGAQRISSTRLYNNRRVQALKPNQEVELLVDPEPPHDAIVRELYL